MKGTGMDKARIMTRFAPFFAAGFLTAALAMSGIFTAASLFGATVVAVTQIDLLAGLVGGTAAACAFGRSKQTA